MQRSKALLLIVAGAVAGCSSPRRTVYVDLDRATAIAALDSKLPDERRAHSPITQPPKQVASQTTPGLSPRTLEDRVLQARSQNLERLMLSIRTESVKRLRNELYRGLMRQLERERTERSKELDEKLISLIEDAHFKAEAEFLKYSEERWPILTDLVAIVGFPLPPKSRIKAPDPALKWEKRQYDRAMSLYDQLASIDSRQQESISKLYAAVDVEISKLRLDVGIETINKLDELETEADEAAQRVVNATNESIELVLKSRPDFVVKSVPAQSTSVTVEAPDWPRIDPTREQKPDIISLRAQVEASAQVWADLRGYQLVKEGPNATDETEDFLKWRKTFTVGP